MAPFQEGLATMRGAEFAGRATATGEWFDQDAPMASHPSLPLPSLAEIVNLENGRRMVVRVNDRQPGAGEEVEVSRLVANELGFSATPAPVSVRYLGPAPVAAASSAGGGPAEPLGVVQPASYDGPPRLRAGYVVQVGAFGSLANAERLRAALEGAGAVQVEPTQAGGEALYRVRIGPWDDRADAEAMRRRLVVSGFPNAIVRAR
jgi:rare lipoprotein A